MTTLRQIITDAYREGGTIQIGTAPEAEQFDEGLRKLQTIIKQLFGNEAGEGFVTVTYGAPVGNSYSQDYDKKSLLDSYYLPSNTRLLVNSNQPQTVYLDPNPQPGARVSIVDSQGTFGSANFTLHANGRSVDGAASVTLNENNTNSQWFYRDDLVEWVKVTDLTADSESPFPEEFDEFLIISLAMRLNPRYGQQTAQESALFLRQVKSQFRSRYRQTEFVPSEVTGLFWQGTSLIDPTTAFNRGLVAK